MRSAFYFLILAFAVYPSAQAQSPLTLEASTGRDLYLTDVSSDVLIEVRIRSAPFTPGSSPTSVRNIAFVLDRSGSMDGAPLQSARKALSNAVNSLSGHDIVSVILFGSEVETLVEAKRRDQLQDLDTLFDRIAPSGGSALYDALNQGAAQLRRFADAKTSNHLVLLTDGPPTKGPREPDDFSRLADVFALEGIVLSSIGLGADFNEDLLVALARPGNGHFRFAPAPEKIEEALQAELGPIRTLVAREATLTLEFNPRCSKIETSSWPKPTIEKTTATFRFPFLFAGQEERILASAEIHPFRFFFDLVKIRLSWMNPSDGKVHETTKSISLTLDSSAEAVRTSARPDMIRANANALIVSGMQETIERIDKGDFRRALATLRRIRGDLRSLNADPSDPDVAAQIQRLDAYITEIQTRGMNLLDRKILRSGLFNFFATPTDSDSPKR